MDEPKRKLAGSKYRDDWRRGHKDLCRSLYMGDGDAFLYEYNPLRVVALLCLSSGWHDGINDVERALYYHLCKPNNIPAFVVYGPDPLPEFPQYIYPFEEYDAIKRKTRDNLRDIHTKIMNAGEYEAWEKGIRNGRATGTL